MKTFLLALLVLLAPATVLARQAPPADLPTNLVAAGTPAGVIRLWGVGAASGDPARHLDDIKVHDGAVTALAWSPEKRLAATGGADKKVKIWRVVEGGDQPIRIIETAHDGNIVALQFTSGGDKLVSAGADGRVRTWNVADGKRLTDVEASKKPLTALVALPEWDLLFTADADGESKIWKATSRPQRRPTRAPLLAWRLCLTRKPTRPREPTATCASGPARAAASANSRCTMGRSPRSPSLRRDGAS
jgi:WD40 repeat protein